MNLKENFAIFGMIEIPSILTLLNGVCGLIAIFFAVEKEFYFAAGFMLAAGIFDFLDGRIARLMKKETLMGKELDSICDMVSFGVAPAVLAFMTTENIGQGWIFAAIIYVLYFVAAAMRLARFNVDKKEKSYKGMPSTINGVIVPILFYMGLTSWYPLWFLIAAVLMVSAFKVPKVI